MGAQNHPVRRQRIEITAGGYSGNRKPLNNVMNSNLARLLNQFQDFSTASLGQKPGIIGMWHE
jgi:hypothetical protein